MNGIARERQVAERLRGEGCLIASRRHEPGPGDLLVIDSDGQGHLVEVKANAGSPWKNFSREDRARLSTVAEEYGLLAALVHWPPRGRFTAYPENIWPQERVAA